MQPTTGAILAIFSKIASKNLLLPHDITCTSARCEESPPLCPIFLGFPDSTLNNLGNESQSRIIKKENYL